MAASLTIESESGTWTGSRHPHNGYYAGDFSDVPSVPQGQLAGFRSAPARSARAALGQHRD
jgi:hypothetical protein